MSQGSVPRNSEHRFPLVSPANLVYKKGNSVSEKFLVIGHRGAMGHAPENTLRSVRKALELGAHGIEVDVYFVDGELVVFHDEKLDRTTNGKGRLEVRTLEYLRSLDAGAGEQIPTLREVLDAIDRKAFVNVELKGRATAGPVVSLLREYTGSKGWAPESLIVSSFDERELRDARALDASLRLGYLSSKKWARRTLKSALEIEAFSLNLGLKELREEAVSEAHREGLAVFVYTVNAPGIAVELESMDVNGVFSDFPDRILNRHVESSAR